MYAVASIVHLVPEAITLELANEVDQLRQQHSPGIVVTEGWLQHVLDSKVDVLVAFTDNLRVFGVAFLHSSPGLEGEYGWLTDLVVHSRYAGQGVEEVLIDRALWVSQTEHNALNLIVVTEQPTVLAACERMGLTVLPKTVMYHKHPYH